MVMIPRRSALVAGAAVVSWDLGKPRVLRRLVGFQEELRNRVKWKLISRNRNWKEYHNHNQYINTWKSDEITMETYLGVKSETLTWPGRFFLVLARSASWVSPRNNPQ